MWITEDQRKHGGAPTDRVPDAFPTVAVATSGLAVLTRNMSEFRDIGVETVNSRISAQR